MKKIFCVLLISALIILTAVCTFSVYDKDYVIYSCSVEKKWIALTFDDGPHPYRTAEILDILKEYGIKATFFVIGENVELYPELVRREIAEGHEIGNHTATHTSLLKADRSILVKELIPLEKHIKEKFGYDVTLIRPPGGQLNENVIAYAKEKDQKIILWSVDTMDWAHTPTDNILSNIKKNISDGGIILFHDYVTGKSPTPDALRSIIPYLISQGYEFVTVSQLIK